LLVVRVCLLMHISNSVLNKEMWHMTHIPGQHVPEYGVTVVGGCWVYGQLDDAMLHSLSM